MSLQIHQVRPLPVARLGRCSAPNAPIAHRLCSKQPCQQLRYASSSSSVSLAACGQRLITRCQASSGADSVSPPWAEKNARLVLEDGSVWHGVAFGATGTEVGEVVFNTSMSGYQVSNS